MVFENLPDIVTVKELAEYLKVSTLTINRAISAGRLKAFKVGRDWRIEKHEVINWLTKK